MRILFFIYLFVLFASTLALKAQFPQDYYLKHYGYDYAINPAITGRDYYPVVNFSNKKYWPGVGESPSSMAIGTIMRLGRYNFYNPKMLLNKSEVLSRSRMGMGGFLMKENNGPSGSLHGSFSYAYFVPINNRDQLSFGLAGQFFQYTLNESEFKPLDPGDEALAPSIDQPFKSEAGFGVYFHNRQLNVGASVNDLFLTDLSDTWRASLTNKRDFFVHGGYIFFLKFFDVEPSVWLGKIDDLNYYSVQGKAYLFTYNWISVSYNSIKNMRYALGLKLNRFHVVYTFEHGMEESLKYYKGTHEISFGINVGLYEAEGIRKRAK